MRVISFNANGLRAAARKGFYDWLAEQDADIVCIQETKAQAAQLTDPVFHPEGFQAHFHDAEKKGYSGVALYTRAAPTEVVRGLGWPEFDAEGRYIEARYDDLAVCSLYMPSGTSGTERQEIKYRLMDRLMDRLKALHDEPREYIICGDWNIAHTTKDVANWRSNQKNSGFLPDERAWLDQLFGEAGFVDAFRLLDDRDGQYTWWSHRGRAWEKNVGWRIDYQVITPGLASRVRSVDVYRGARFSDHAPLIVDYEL